jgi:hypothetical protein
VQAVLACSLLAVANHSVNGQGIAREGPEEGDGFAREQREEDCVDVASQVVTEVVTVCARSRLHNHGEILQDTHFQCATSRISVGQRDSRKKIEQERESGKINQDKMDGKETMGATYSSIHLHIPHTNLDRHPFLHDPHNIIIHSKRPKQRLICVKQRAKELLFHSLFPSFYIVCIYITAMVISSWGSVELELGL